jgi:AraC-like DNA-binding protein
MRAAEGLTRARSMGPVAAAVRRSGGSLARVFRRVELPLSLLDHPDALIPLRDQLRLVELAAREIGDEALPARLSLGGGVEHLGEFGRHVCSAARLDVAIARCNERMSAALQSATVLGLSISGRMARWTYSVTDDARVGRQKNEVLALGYMLDLLTQYFGVPAHAIHAQLPGARVMADRKSVEQLFGCEVSEGAIAALDFSASWLAASNRTGRAGVSPLAGGDAEPLLPGVGESLVPRAGESVLPRAGDLIAQVEHMIALGLMERRPHEDWLCRRLHISRRLLQRALAARNTTYRDLLLRALMDRAVELLRSQLSVTEIALELGYSDTAHFTRAFTRRFGESPQSWRRRASIAQ